MGGCCNCATACCTIGLLPARGYLGHMPAKKRTSSLRRNVSAPKRAVSVLPKSYAAVLEAVKERIRTAQLKAALAVNSELVMLYWSIGREIMERPSVATMMSSKGSSAANAWRKISALEPKDRWT